MTSKHGKQALKEEETSSGPMPLNVFFKDLEKESPEFHKKLTHDTTSSFFKDEKKFMEELKKHAPKLYDKLKQCNFKFHMDTSTQKEWLNLVDKAKNMITKLEEFEKGVGFVPKD